MPDSCGPATIPPSSQLLCRTTGTVSVPDTKLTVRYYRFTFKIVTNSGHRSWSNNKYFPVLNYSSYFLQVPVRYRTIPDSGTYLLFCTDLLYNSKLKVFRSTFYHVVRYQDSW
jgi:hypothetical protein